MQIPVHMGHVQLQFGVNVLSVCTLVPFSFSFSAICNCVWIQ